MPALAAVDGTVSRITFNNATGNSLVLTRGWYLRSNGQAAGNTVATFIYGMQPGDQPIAGDWDGNGTTDPGIYRGTRFHLKGSLTAGTASTIDLGTSGGQPLVGVWSDSVRPGIGTFRPRTA